ncbi:hypothetical protein R3P38DRAFT_2809426 [Favolaschia claudopus]|uniref:Uncharacterized protein n=1 Tax=Favolaschia claudopus TaxID=2862362 RepID=A0AAV9ZE44_9AGAR
MAGGKSGIFLASLNAKACTSWNLCISSWKIALYSDLFDKGELRAAERNTAARGKTAAEYSAVGGEPAKPGDRRQGGGDCLGCRGKSKGSGGHSATTGLSGAVGYRIQRRSFEESFIESKGTSRGTALGCHRSQGMAGGKSGIFLASLNAKACTSWNLVQQGLGAVVEQSHCSCS